MSAYSGQRSQTIVGRICSNVYGWSAGGPAENLGFIGGANSGYFEWMEGLIDWVKVNQGLMVSDPDMGCLRFPAEKLTLIIVEDSYSLTGDGRRH
eukprot:10366139-Alexandrium_andersonii.AAC.1